MRKTEQRKRWTRTRVAAALWIGAAVAWLGACGRPPAPVQETPLAIAQVAATSQTSVAVTFDAPVDVVAASAASYRIVGPDGAALDVLHVHPISDPRRVVLVTAPQLLVPYRLTATGVAPAGGVAASAVLEAPAPFVGSDAPAPALARAAALDARRVLVWFADPETGQPVAMDDAAVDPTRYRVDDGAIAVLGAAFAARGEDRTRVVVTTAPLEDAMARIEASGIAGHAAGVPIDPFRASASFRGIAPVDTVAPEVVGAFAISDTAVVVRFSEPVAASAADPDAYTVLDGDGAPVPVSGAVLDDVALQATLTTWPMARGTSQTVSVANVADRAGNPIAANATPFRVPTGDAPVDVEPPRVVGAIATGATSVVVTFSERVVGGATGAENPANYQIVDVATLDGLRPQAVLFVQAATLSASGRAVTLTTLAQSGLEYALRVANVTDLAGNQIVGPDRDRPYQVTFVGTAGTGPSLDSDGDGLSDADEQRGWTVRIVLGDGRVETRQVTSDPFKADTDGDLVSDLEEFIYGTDPRATDTDRDGLTDLQELNQIYSDPANQDSDGDGLLDGLEWSFFRTSPVLADTDGDQIPDGDEVVLANRNPRVADLPLPAIEIGAVDLSLDVRFTATSEAGSRVLESRTAASTLSQSERRAYSTTDANSHQFAAKVTAGMGYELGGDAGVGKLSAKFEVETGYTGQWSSSFTSESANETQREYANSLQTDAETTRNESVTREVVGASLRASILLRNVGDIAFTISNLEVTAFMIDPTDPGRFLPVATLTPQTGADRAYNLGPLIPVRGPLVFESTTVFPSLVEALMRDPRGLVFRVANFDLTDEFGRNFAFTSQEIADRTAPLVIDFGGMDGDGDGISDDSARYRISTSAGRIIDDLNEDKVVDERDRTLFDAQGRQVGITLREAFEQVLGLTRYDEDATPASTLDALELERSYATREVGGVTVLWRIGGVAMDRTNPRRKWEVLTPAGIDRTIGFDERILRTEDGVTLAYVQDLDDDRIPARIEYLLGCSDLASDTDGDGISDYDEVYVGWTVEIVGRGSYTATSSCARLDSDLDGLDDDEEQTLGTDPSRADTDGDGIADFDEMNGYVVELRFGFDAAASSCTPLGGNRVRCTSDPLNPDSDGDTVNDGRERRLGVDPTVDDRDRALDDDGDGLVNFEEADGWTVTFRRVSTVPGQQGVQVVCTPIAFAACGAPPTSDPRRADTDGDGVPDAAERDLGLHPRLADTDGDGVPDGQEVRYDAAGDRWVYVYDPLDADMDDDLRSDGAELTVPITVRVAGEAPYTVFSDPMVADEDLDGLVDGDEAQFGTDPKVFDTDGDGTHDGVEVARNRDANASNDTDPLAKDQLLTLAWEGRGVRHSNNLICGETSISATGGRGWFYGNLYATVNGVDWHLPFQAILGDQFAAFTSVTRVYRGGAITARGSGLQRRDSGAPDVYYNLQPFGPDTVVGSAGPFQAVGGITQRSWTARQVGANDDVCTLEARLTITPVTD